MPNEIINIPETPEEMPANRLFSTFCLYESWTEAEDAAVMTVVDHVRHSALRQEIIKRLEAYDANR